VPQLCKLRRFGQKAATESSAGERTCVGVQVHPKCGANGGQLIVKELEDRSPSAMAGGGKSLPATRWTPWAIGHVFVHFGFEAS